MVNLIRKWTVFRGIKACFRVFFFFIENGPTDYNADTEMTISFEEKDMVWEDTV